MNDSVKVRSILVSFSSTSAASVLHDITNLTFVKVEVRFHVECLLLGVDGDGN